MSSRYIKDNASPEMLSVATAQAVTVGDLVTLNASNQVIRASDVAWDVSLGQTQLDFISAIDTFVGVAAQTKVAGTARVFGNGADNLMRVDTAGVFEFDCVSAIFTVGQFVGPAKDVGNALLNQTVVGVADQAHAIGVVVDGNGGVATTRVKVRLLSKAVPFSHT